MEGLLMMTFMIGVYVGATLMFGMRLTEKDRQYLRNRLRDDDEHDKREIDFVELVSGKRKDKD